VTDAKYAELMDCLHKTPERFAASVAKPQTLTRCLRLVAAETPADVILALMLVAIRACAAYGNSSTYYMECGNVASRFAYATSSSAALDVRSTLEELCHRDPKFIAALGQAMAVLEATAMGN
jgi:hypothetical protein